MFARAILKAGGRISREIKNLNCVAVRFRCYSYDTMQVTKKSVGTMSDVHNEIMRRLGLDHGYQPIPKSREHLSKYEPKLEDLPPRSMQDSFTSAIIPLREDKELQDKYVSFVGNIRLGRLLEDMDAFAVWVMHNHVELPNLPEGVSLPYTFVTVLVDKVDFAENRIKVNKDIKISGYVDWVGRTTAEIVVMIDEIGENGKDSKRITRALFLMASRNATNTASLVINPLVPANEEEQNIYLGAVERNKVRKKLRATSIFKVEPTQFEDSLMYSLYKRTTDSQSMELHKRILPDNCRWMSKSFAVNTVASFPEHRNAQNTVFGGFIMRSALEISYVTGCIYSRNRPMIKHLCDISFEKPVSVNSILKMTAYVVYTEANYLTIMTVVDIVDSISGMQITSNVFYTILEAFDYVPEVLPRSYQETMWYIHGRRKFLYSLGLA